MSADISSKARILGVIPARGGSKSIPRKNITPLGGKPLISYMVEAVLESGMVDDLVVSSEDDEILAVAKKYGEGKVRLVKRPSELAEDDTPSLPVVKHAVLELEKERGKPYDYVVMFQCTTPLVAPDDIKNAISLLIESGADSVMSVFKTNESHPMKAKRLLPDGRLVQYVEGLDETQFTRQKLEPVYRRNGAVYASRRDVVMLKDKLYGGDDIDTRGYVMPEERSVDINSPVDLIVAEALLKLREGKAS